MEARLNATNQALQPHAGGIIESWSDAIEGEIRDDQGIGVRNPDTGAFVYYNLAGAYDSNIALIASAESSSSPAPNMPAPWQTACASKMSSPDRSHSTPTPHTLKGFP